LATQNTDNALPAAARDSARSQPNFNLLLLLIGLSALLNYIDRSNLSIAAPLIKDELGITGAQLGTLLSAFFWTYALLQIPAGWLVDRFDVKWVFAAGFFIWSGATAITSVIHGFTALLVIRVVLGIGESVSFCSYGKILSTYYHETRRGFANAAINGGLALGPAVGMLMGGSIVARFGWRTFFLGLGFIGMLWLPLWFSWMPRQSPIHHSSAPGGTFGQLLRQRSVWGTAMGQLCVNYYLYFLVTWLPYYLVRERHLSLSSMGRHGALLFLLSAISTAICGKLSDRWIASGSTPTFARKVFMVCGQLLVGVFFLLTVTVSQRFLLLTLALLGVALGMSICNSWTIAQTIAGPRMVGRWVGVQNFVGNFAGVIAPILTGFLLDRTGNFFWSFCITAGVAWLGAVCWRWIVGPVTQVDWEASPRRKVSSDNAITGESVA
jgi:MFS family permease